MKKILKFMLTMISIAIFVMCICEEVDGVGRFAMILFGTIFAICGSYLK